MNARDLIGKRGEAIAVARLMEFCSNPLPYFDPHPLGEKCPTFDFLVELVGAGKSPPYFLAQVKSTRRGRRPGRLSLKAGMKAQDVQRMVHSPIPTYLIGVEEPAVTAYIVSIHGDLIGPVSSIPTSYPLDCVNLKILHDEVRTHWQTLGTLAGSKTLAFLL